MGKIQFKMKLERDFEAFWKDSISLWYNCETFVEQNENVFTVTDILSGKKLAVIEVNEELIKKDSNEPDATAETAKNQK